MSNDIEMAKVLERVRVFERCESHAIVLSGIQKQCREGSNEAEALKTAKDVLLFVVTRRLDEFIEFLLAMNAGLTIEEEERLRKLGITLEEH